jgi:type IV pilus assembly protein PilB
LCGYDILQAHFQHKNMLTPDDKAIKIKQVYSDLNRKFEEEEAHHLAASLKLPYINLFGFPIDHNALSLIPKDEAMRMEAAVFYNEGQVIKLATTKPSQELESLVGNFRKQNYKAEIYVVSKSSLKRVMGFYDRLMQSARKSQDVILKSPDYPSDFSSFSDLAKKVATASATEVIDIILGNALVLDASDVHVEPLGSMVHVRFRIDGVLQNVTTLPKENYKQLISRIKILSKLKLNITTTPQDGSFGLTFDQKQIDVRVSVLPSAFGESAVMRILRQDMAQLKMEDLGVRPSVLELLLNQIQKPNGMVLTTGPTGSGKTTTLYSILNKLNEPGVKIITLEDPVEYKISGITQTPIDSQSGVTFASGLRAILRQDPDVIMVGEMRDLETAEVAAQAALTGHIVLSTLHTNDAAGAIPRLIDLGVKPFVLAPAINAVIAQRLVRKLCVHCKTEYVPDKHLVSRAEMILSSMPKALKPSFKNPVFFHSPGCKQCKSLGYKGRIGVYEIFTITEAIEKLITLAASNTDIKKQAVADGMLTMAQDGVLKALEGITDLEEVFRVTEE